MMRVLETKELSVRFGDHLVLDKVSADFTSGRMTAIIGSNGVGKTTYLKAIAQLVRAEGSVVLNEDGVRGLDKKTIAYVPQLGSLHTKLTAFEMVLLGLVNSLKWHVTDEQIELVYQTLSDLGIRHIARQPFDTLSGGQKQLVSMAQSLISAKEAETGTALDNLGKVGLVYEWVVTNLTYDFNRAKTVQPGYLPDVDSVMAEKKGICFDYAALMASMLRSQGVPVKLVVGYTSQGVYHAWINVWSEEGGWVEGMIYFDGKIWKLMDPTYASSGKQSNSIMQFINNSANYKEKYFY